MQKRTADLLSSTGVYELSDQLLVLEDGSVGLGYAVQGFADEALEGAGYLHFIQSLRRSLEKLPPGTMLQQLDSYYEAPFGWQPPQPTTLLQAEQQRYHAGRKVLQHQALLYLLFPGVEKARQPMHTFLATGSQGLQVAFQQLARSIAAAQKHGRAFENTFQPAPGQWGVQRLSDQANLQRLYGYFNLDFSGQCTAFENTMVNTPKGLQLGGKHVRVVSMQSQSAAPHYFSHNGLGYGKGVTVPFTWPLSHYLPFPHITVQAIRLLDTEALLGSRSEALAWSAGAQTQERGLRNATTAREDLAAFETALRKAGGTMSTLDLLVILYGDSEAVVSEQVEIVKKEFRRLQAQPLVETYDVANLFFASMPGGGLQLYRGLPMPLETALAYLNTITPRQGAQEGVLLADRHGTPIYYDPFNTALDNQNAFVFGPSGSGKSFFNGKLIKERYEAGHVVLVIDSGGTYRRLFALLGGQYIEYSAETPLQLNPFLLPKQGSRYVPTVSKLNFLVQLLGKMWKGDLNQHPMEEAEQALLAKWLPAYYAQEKEVPTLTGFYDWLKAYVASHPAEVQELGALFAFQDFFVVLEPFAHGVYKEHLNAPAAQQLLDHPLVCRATLSATLW